MLGRLLQNMDEETAEKMMSNLSEEHLNNALQTGIENQLVPHLTDIRDRANEDDATQQQVRAHYESLSEEEQTEKFTKAAADLMGVAVELREDPVNGLEKLKGRLRDPYVIEGLLLVFEHDEMPDDAVTERKEFAANWLKNIGVHVIPEVYERGDVREMIETFYPDKDPDAVLAELGVTEEGDSEPSA